MEHPDIWTQIFTILIGATLINNLVLNQFLGLCPVFGISGKIKPSIELGMVITAVMGVSSLIIAILWNFILLPFHLEYLKILVFILVITGLVQLIRAYPQKIYPDLDKKFGTYLIIAASNCIVLAAPLQSAEKFNYSLTMPFFERILHGIGLPTLYGIAAGAGFALAIVLLSYIRDRLELSDIPEPLKGIPISFIVMGLLAIAFMGFSNMKF
jgi:electron transport complex protein RnfA